MITGSSSFPRLERDLRERHPPRFILVNSGPFIVNQVGDNCDCLEVGKHSQLVVAENITCTSLLGIENCLEQLVAHDVAHNLLRYHEVSG